MRLWHKELVPILPRKQLVGQWRECVAVVGLMAEAKDSLANMTIVAKVMDYPLEHLTAYTRLVIKEMNTRGYRISDAAYEKWLERLEELGGAEGELCEYLVSTNSELFNTWHNDRYFWQCYYNLEEKYDCGSITQEEFNPIRALAVQKYTSYIRGTVLGMETRVK